MEFNIVQIKLRLIMYSSDIIICLIIYVTAIYSKIHDKTITMFVKSVSRKSHKIYIWPKAVVKVCGKSFY